MCFFCSMSPLEGSVQTFVQAFKAKVHRYVAESIRWEWGRKNSPSYSQTETLVSASDSFLDSCRPLKTVFSISAGRLEPFFSLDIQKMIKPSLFTEEQLWSGTLKWHISDEPNVLHKLNVTECDLEGEIGLQSWQADSGWPPRRSPSLVPLPVRHPESSPRACPRWHSCRIQPRSAPSPAAAPPERLHTCTYKIRTACMCDMSRYIHKQSHDLVHNNTQLLSVCS